MIEPTSFYSNEGEKIKLNWFCYELSIGILNGIRRSIGKQLKKVGINNKTLADFSICVSKDMKYIILEKLSGKIEIVSIAPEMVEPYFPYISGELVNKIMDIILKEWDKQLRICEMCPTRCISEKDAYCTMFDEGPYGCGNT